ncbi:MAG: hypothetical protein CM1200mP10_22310 [Candidatus Neomarinimicrobiota bacterium]|nr:MAG: hypothetical protein CM1200mP10_22310 [Candidatus Neomarinimicrobiota bacterium]
MMMSWSFSGYSDNGWDIFRLANPMDMNVIEINPTQFIKTENREMNYWLISVGTNQPVLTLIELQEEIIPIIFLRQNTGIITKIPMYQNLIQVCS